MLLAQDAIEALAVAPRRCALGQCEHFDFDAARGGLNFYALADMHELAGLSLFFARDIDDGYAAIIAGALGLTALLDQSRVL